MLPGHFVFVNRSFFQDTLKLIPKQPGLKYTTFNAKQLDLSRLLLEELRSMGLTETELDENGYVYASIPSNR